MNLTHIILVFLLLLHFNISYSRQKEKIVGNTIDSTKESLDKDFNSFKNKVNDLKTDINKAVEETFKLGEDINKVDNQLQSTKIKDYIKRVQKIHKIYKKVNRDSPKYRIALKNVNKDLSTYSNKIDSLCNIKKKLLNEKTHHLNNLQNQDSISAKTQNDINSLTSIIGFNKRTLNKIVNFKETLQNTETKKQKLDEEIDLFLHKIHNAEYILSAALEYLQTEDDLESAKNSLKTLDEIKVLSDKITRSLIFLDKQMKNLLDESI